KLQQRLETLLNCTRNRRPACRRGLLVAILIALGLLLPVASVGFQKADAAMVVPILEEDTTTVEEDTPPVADSKDAVKRLAEIQKKLREHYVAPIDDKQLMENALRAWLKSLKDPYTDYIAAEEYAALERQFKGALTGIGAQLKMVNQRVTVVTPLEDSPALKAGLRPGDIIDSIDGKSARGIDIGEAISRILGKADTVVKLKVIHADGVVEELAVTRAQIRVRTVNGFRRGADGQWSYWLDPEHKVGYAHVQQFGGNTSREL